MESHSTQHLDSAGDSSHPHRETIDLDNPLPPQPTTIDQSHLLPQQSHHTAGGNDIVSKVKFLVSYGGRIHPRPLDNHLSYVGGETKILALDRNVSFPALLSKVSSLCDAHVHVKYQLPGEDLDALVSVTDDDDLQHLMHEYDRLHRVSSPRPARLRLFLFPLSPNPQAGRCGVGGGDRAKMDTAMFIEALNSSGQVRSAAQQPQTKPYPIDFDLFFGLTDKPGGILVDGAPPTVKAEDQVLDPEILPGSPPRADPDPQTQINSGIQELNRLQISAPGGADRSPKGEDNPFRRDSHAHAHAQNPPHPQHHPMIPPAYWPPMPQEKSIAGGECHHQPGYMISSPAGATLYHPSMVRTANGKAGQGGGNYQMPSNGSDLYREQPAYSMVPTTTTTQHPPPHLYSQVPQPTVPSSPNPTPDGMGQVPGASGGMSESVYGLVGYHGMTGRQVHYNAAGAGAPSPGGGMPTAAQYQGVAVNGDVKPVAYSNAAAPGGGMPTAAQYHGVAAKSEANPAVYSTAAPPVGGRTTSVQYQRGAVKGEVNPAVYNTAAAPGGGMATAAAQYQGVGVNGDLKNPVVYSAAAPTNVAVSTVAVNGDV